MSQKGQLQRAEEIATELEKSETWRARGGTVVAVATAILSMIPVAGGPLAVLCEKVGGALTDAQIEPKFVELCNLVAALAPDLDCVKELDAKISVVAATLKANKGAMDRLTELLGQLHKGAVDTVGVKTIAARQDFINVSIRDMEVLVEAHQAGVNVLKGVKTKGGSVQFVATSGGHQRVEDSTFTGKSGSSVGMDKLTLGGRVGTVDGGPENPGIGLGPGGSIGFGPGGVLGFGPKKTRG